MELKTCADDAGVLNGEDPALLPSRGPGRMIPSLDQAEQTGGVAAPCFYATISVREAVRRIVRGEWDIPDFQRDFVWGPKDVCLLADSLMRGYPIPIVLLWRGEQRQRSARTAQLLVVDGQHRLTAACLLFGTAPAWCRVERDELLRRFEIRIDPQAERPSFLRIASEAGEGSMPLSAILSDEHRSRAGLMRLAREIKQQAACRLEMEELCARLESARQIRERSLIVSVANVGGADVHEIFARLNCRGIRFRRLLLKMMMQAVPELRRWKHGRASPCRAG